MSVASAAEFGRVAVMLGGHSSEREVSLDSGAAARPTPNEERPNSSC